MNISQDPGVGLFVPTVGQSDVIDVHAMLWQVLGPDVRCKVLYRDDATGISVVLFNFAPGAVTPLHVHTGIECTFVLEGSLEDHDSMITAATARCARRAAPIRRTPHRAARTSPFSQSLCGIWEVKRPHSLQLKRQ